MFSKLLYLFICIYLAYAKTCQDYLSELVQKQVEFLQCVTKHAVPVSLCIGCRDSHDEMLQIYDILASNCSSMYFDNDRINIIASAESSLVNLWTKAYCDDCFNNNNSVIFDQKNTTFYNCLSNTKNDQKCEKCKIKYMDLNSFYIHLDQHNNGEVCFDLQDSINRTRNMWSKGLNCCQREYNMKLFTIALSLICFLPAVFYTSMYFITKYQDQNHQRVLYDDSLYNTPLPSTSARVQNNNLNHPATSSSSVSSASSAANNNLSSVAKSKNTIPYNILNKQHTDSSDDDEPIISTVNKDKIK